MIQKLFLNSYFSGSQSKLLQVPLEAVSISYKWLEYLLQSLGKCFIRLQYNKILETVQKSDSKIVSKQAAEQDY